MIGRCQKYEESVNASPACDDFKPSCLGIVHRTFGPLASWASMVRPGCQRSTSVPPSRCLRVCTCATVEPELGGPHGANDLDSQAHRRKKGRRRWNELHSVSTCFRR